MKRTWVSSVLFVVVFLACSSGECQKLFTLPGVRSVPVNQDEDGLIPVSVVYHEILMPDSMAETFLGPGSFDETDYAMAHVQEKHGELILLDGSVVALDLADVAPERAIALMRQHPVTSISVRAQDLCSPGVVEAMGEAAPERLFLKVTARSSSAGEAELEPFVDCLAALKTSRLYLSHDAVSEALLTRLKRFKNLVGLQTGYYALTSREVALLAQLQGLKYLRVEVAQGGVKELAKLKHLEVLSVECDLFSECGWESISEMTHLKVLEANTGGGDCDWAIGPARGLEALGTLTCWANYYSAETDLADGMKHLRRLRLRAPLTDRALKVLSKLNGLEELAFEDNFDGNGITGEGFSHLSSLSNLRLLRAPRTNIAAPNLAHLAKLTSLEVLEVHSVYDLRDRDLATLGRWKTLHYLPMLVGDAVTDKGLAELGRLTKLKTLTLLFPHVTAAGVAHLEGLKAIRRLEIHSQAGDELLVPVSKLKSLEELEIGLGDLSGTGLGHLDALPRLRTLRIGRAKDFDPAKLVLLLDCPSLKELDLRELGLKRGDMPDIPIEGLRILLEYESI